VSATRHAVTTRSVLGIAVLALSAVAAIGSPGAALAYDPTNSWINYALRGERAPSYEAQSYDRSFVREGEANPPRGYPTLSRDNIGPTKLAIKRYAQVVKNGDFPRVPAVQLQRGSSGAEVAVLRERLTLSGDLREETSYPNSFDYYLEKAVKRFQASNGLTPTGIVDQRTRAALNVPAKVRLQQLRTNLSRLGQYVSGMPKRYVMVNIPAAQVEAVENNLVVSRHSGVVGKIDRKTPILTSAVHEMNFNPMWRLPPTVIHKDLIPKGRQMQRNGQSVLVKYGIDAYDGNGRKLDPEKVNFRSGMASGLRYSQKPGKDNPLGFLKINFHNAHSVYMHDTPSDSIFGRNFRAASSGCIRVQGIEELAAWLLKDSGWSVSDVERIKASGERKDVRLKRPVPLYFVYITAWATEDGLVQFRRDLYRRDGVGAVASAY